MNEKKPRLRFKMQDKEKGLARVGAAPRGHDLYYGSKRVAVVSPLGGGWGGPLRGWYFFTYDNRLPFRNTCGTPVATPEEAKADCMAYVRAHLTTEST